MPVVVACAGWVTTTPCGVVVAAGWVTMTPWGVVVAWLGRPRARGARPKIPGTCYFWKKKAPARQPRVVVGMGFTGNPKFKEFWQKEYHLPKRYVRQNDATSFLYPMPISLFNLFTKLIYFEGNLKKIICLYKNSRSTALAAVMLSIPY